MKQNQNFEKSLEKDIQAFEKKLPELENHHKGKWVLFYDGEFIDAFDDFNMLLFMLLKNTTADHISSVKLAHRHQNYQHWQCAYWKPHNATP